MPFEPLYHGDKLHQVNPDGDVGLITLWSPYRTVERKLRQVAPDVLHPERSRVAVAANLYGDGMHAMLCNLLYNPQVRHLVAVGQDLGLATCDELDAFLAHGVQRDEILGRPVERVAGTQRVFPRARGFDAERLRARLSFQRVGKLSRADLGPALAGCLDALPRSGGGDAERVRVELPEVSAPATFLPSRADAHQVVRSRPLDCWRELVVRTVRFGRPVELAKGARLELLNARAVIADPAPDPPDALARHGFDRDRFEAYQRRILDPELPDGISYTYGNRLRGGLDTLAAAAERLREDPESRGAYVSLWDNGSDLAGAAASKPCLTTLFFRRSEGRLTLTATYRSHNLLTAWLENVYGLMAVQAHLAERAGMAPGSITVVSHSLGIDPASPSYELARALADGWDNDDDFDHDAGKFALREDPHGYFVVSADRESGTIVAEHRYGGVLLKRYEAQRAVTIERQVAADMAVSLPSHAMWLGRELSAKERELR